MLYLTYYLYMLLCVIMQSSHGDEKESSGPTPTQTEGGFGGVLYLRLDHRLTNHSGIITAAKFATNQWRRPADPGGSSREDYTITSAAVSKVVYTQDGQTPFLLPVVDTDSGQSLARPLIWGVLYTFCLTPLSSPLIKHSYTVLQYWDSSYHIFLHTFRAAHSPPNARPLRGNQPLSSPPGLEMVAPPTRLAHAHSSAQGVVPNVDVVPTAGADKKKTLSPNLVEESVSCYGSRDLHLGSDFNLPVDIEPRADPYCNHQCAISSCRIASIGFCQCFSRKIENVEVCRKPSSRMAFLHSVMLDCDKVAISEYLKKTNKMPSKKHLGKNVQGDGAAGCRHVYTAKVGHRNKTMLFKVLNFNIWNVNVVEGNDADYADRIRHLALICRTSGADVIGLQEVRFQESSGGVWGPNQMRHLADLLPGYQYVYEPAQVQTGHLPKMAVEGVAFMSKHPITAHSRLMLQRNPRDPADGHQRVLLHVEVQLPHVGEVHLFNTHLSLSHRARASSVLQMVPYMDSFSGPAFLLGDFNSEAHNVEVQFLDGRAELRGRRAAGWNDVWRLRHGLHDPGFTFSTLDSQLTKRIDLIFMREHSRVSLVDVRIIDDKKRRAHAASDHLPLLAEFSLTS